MATLELRNVSKSFGATKVLQEISVTLADGEFLVLVGPSGCGKSTLMNIVAGLEEPTNGSLALEGKDITRLAPAQRNIAMVFQSYALYPNMTVAENIAFPLEMRKVPKTERDKRVAEVAALLQIEHLLGRKPKQLSGGQRQRVAIGRALAREPQLFLFDEPLSNLDAKLRVDMRAEIKRLHQRTGVTTIYVTHDQVEAMTLASRIAVLKGGVIQQLATPLDLYTDPANLFVAEFIGSPSINQLEATAVAADRIRLGSGTELPLGRPHPIEAGRKLVLGVRPEHLREDAAGSLTGRVTIVEPTGAEAYVKADIGGAEVCLRIPGLVAMKPDDPIRIAHAPGSLLLFDPESGMRIR
jgi:multiple sugar transport system ATP-binding protein